MLPVIYNHVAFIYVLRWFTHCKIYAIIKLYI